MTREEFWKGLMLEANAIADMRQAVNKGYSDLATALKVAQVAVRHTEQAFDNNIKTLNLIKTTNVINVMLMIVGVSMMVLNLVLLVIR